MTLRAIFLIPAPMQLRKTVLLPVSGRMLNVTPRNSFRRRSVLMA